MGRRLKPKAPKQTESAMLSLIQQRFNAVNPGNGPRYVVATHVRSHAGFDARRTADAIVLDCWPSKGLEMHGMEVKCSRSDWLNELKDPSKAEEFKRYCDRWWLVIADPEMVKPGELPEGWGMMVPTRRTTREWSGKERRWVTESKTTLRVVTPAPKLHPLPTPRTLTTSLARAIQSTAIGVGAKREREDAKSVVHDRGRLGEANAWAPLESWEHPVHGSRTVSWDREQAVGQLRDQDSRSGFYYGSTATEKWKKLRAERRAVVQ